MRSSPFQCHLCLPHCTWRSRELIHPAICCCAPPLSRRCVHTDQWFTGVPWNQPWLLGKATWTLCSVCYLSYLNKVGEKPQYNVCVTVVKECQGSKPGGLAFAWTPQKGLRPLPGDIIIISHPLCSLVIRSYHCSLRILHPADFNTFCIKQCFNCSEAIKLSELNPRPSIFGRAVCRWIGGEAVRYPGAWARCSPEDGAHCSVCSPYTQWHIDRGFPANQWSRHTCIW